MSFLEKMMSENIKPILSSLILGPLSIHSPGSAVIPLEKTIPTASPIKSSSLRKMRFDCAYQPNLFSVLSTETPMGKYVGELQEKWQFPSDHLPIGMTVDGIHLASWNVLNSAYMNWVFENSQGLSRSLITKEHIYLEGSKLTVRDLHVIEGIKSMLSHPTHPRSVLSLQECSEAFLAELQKQLPERYEIILSSDLPMKDQNIVIYDKQLLNYHAEKSSISKIFSEDEKKSVMNLYFSRVDTGQALRIINGHLPGAPGNPAPDEFARFVSSFASSNELIIAMGDMNFHEVEMKAAFQKNTPLFDCLSPYCTNITPLEFFSKSIDHFFILNSEQHPAIANHPEQVLTGLSETVDLLQGKF